MIDVKAGDEVKLKSGGPPMRVLSVGLPPQTGLEAIDAAGEVKANCQWLHEGKVIERRFLPAVLMMAEAESAVAPDKGATRSRRVGEVFQLMTDAPAMTVYQVGRDEYGEHRVWYQWFDGTTPRDDSTRT